MENGIWNSFESFPFGHQGPQHCAHLAVANSELLVFLLLHVITVESKVEL